MNLFNIGEYMLHSGETSGWKIDCDALTDADLDALAYMIHERLGFIGEVEGVPTGGLRLAEALKKYSVPGGRLFIADDVLTTGASMEEQRAGRPAVGVVLFARNRPPKWVRPLFQMWGWYAA